MNCQELYKNGCLKELARIFNAEEKALKLLLMIDFPEENMPRFGDDAESFWFKICKEITNGILDSGGSPELLFTEALSTYKGNAILKKCAPESDGLAQEEEPEYSLVRINGNVNTRVYLGFIRELAASLGINSVSLCYSNNESTVFRINGGDGCSGESLREAIESQVNDASIQVEFLHQSFEPYLLSSLTLVGPNLTRIEKTDVPASTPVEDLVKPIQNARDETTGEPIWPHDQNGQDRMPVVNWLRKDGAHPLNLKESLHGNRIQDGAVLQVTPENTSGSHDSTIPRLYVEGPDGGRFELNDIPVDTPIKEIARATILEYDSGIWPTDENSLPRPAVVDRVTPDGSGERLNPNSTIGDSNIQDGDTLQVFPERTAGSVNPLIREEALARVRKQVLAYAKAHSGFKVSANATHIPTEYLFNFHASSFGQPEFGEKPYPLDQHKVFLFLSADFPMKAPAVHWQVPIFHPNIHPKNGEVCLGVLQDKYKPGMDFGELCQMLVDLATYRNYELREGYNKAAAEWAFTSEGQAAIHKMGGRSLTEWLINLAKQEVPPLLGIKRL